MNQGLCFRELFEHPEQWTQARAITGSLLYADWAFREFSDAELASWFAQMQQWNVRLELEVGGVKEWGAGTGQSTFDSQKPEWDRIQRLGGNIMSVAMDEPLCCVRSRIHKPDEYAVDETAKFIGLVRTNYPGIKVADIEPYPYIPLADQIAWIQVLQKRLAENGTKGMDFYRLDVDWLSFELQEKGSWKEVKKLEDYCRSIGLPFSLVYWSPAFDMMKSKGLADDSTWNTGTMAQGYDYAAVGGAPDQYVLESWINCPSHSVPESADYTFTAFGLGLRAKVCGSEAVGNQPMRVSGALFAGIAVALLAHTAGVRAGCTGSFPRFRTRRAPGSAIMRRRGASWTCICRWGRRGLRRWSGSNGGGLEGGEQERRRGDRAESGARRSGGGVGGSTG